MDENFYIKKIIKDIEDKVKWKNIELWTDYEYKKLSQQIFEKTTISISPQTIKRLFGKVKYKEIYHPQPATKDALAAFLGYKDWINYINSDIKLKSFSKVRLKIKRKVVKWIYTLIALLTIIIIVLAISNIYFKNNKQPVVFYARNLTGTVPHTVSFHYDISRLKNREVFIDFDEGEEELKNKYEKLDISKKLINHCFESPGFYTIRLLVDGEIQASVKVHVLSEGWASYYFNDDNFTLRKFIFKLENKVKINKKDSLLYVSPESLTNQGFKGNTVYYLEHLLYQNFDVSVDSCEFEVKYKNSPEMGGISCYDVESRLIGENGIASVLLVQKGCFRWSEATIGETHLNGKYYNLSNLSLDLTSWNIMKVVVRHNKALIISGNDTLLNCEYHTSIGNLKGIRFVTKGSGAFDYVKLFDSTHNLKFHDNFDN